MTRKSFILFAPLYLIGCYLICIFSKNQGADLLEKFSQGIRKIK